MKVLITGSSGLIGSELVRHFDREAAQVVGVDNRMRADFFGPEGDTLWNLEQMSRMTRNFRHRPADIRDRRALEEIVREDGPFEPVVHRAAQPRHDLAARRPLDDFDVNAVGTINLLEAVRRSSPEAVFVHLSTNKVHGDVPDELSLVELPRRWDDARAADREGVELHGFLSDLVKAQLRGRPDTIHGYKGKQVRDNLHSLDVAPAIEAVYGRPGAGEVHNLGGGRDNSCSIHEAFDHVERLTGRAMEYTCCDAARRGGHICYISDVSKFRRVHPEWTVTRPLEVISEGLVRASMDRMSR